MNRLVIYLLVMALVVACKQSEQRSSEELVSASTPSPSPAPARPPPPKPYAPPDQRDFWLITASGIALPPEVALPGKTVAFLYSSWCPKVRESIPKLLKIILPEVPAGYRYVGIFANGELSQLLDNPEHMEHLGVNKRQQDVLKAKLKKQGIGTGLLENEYAYRGELSFPRFRIPRDQWEKLGGSPGGLKIVCFNNGLKHKCPMDLETLWE